MCGIAGIIDPSLSARALAEQLPPMIEAMACRGPDARGAWTDDGVGLGHTRNSVIDLEGGRQPMVALDSDDRPVAVIDYVGEIYNFRELREVLRGHGHRFHTDSDTEVALRGYVQWGPDVASKIEGIFGFAVWDVRRRELVLVRDYVGVKPLYYSLRGDRLVFGSEPKAILAAPDGRAEVDLDGLRTVLSYGRVPGATPFVGIRAVKPGHVVRYSADGLTEHRYWSLPAREHEDDLATTITTVRQLTEEAVRSQTMSDVPWGVMLSGGLDSSVTAAMAVASTGGPGAGLRSFSLDFSGHQDRFRPTRFRPLADEPFAQAMADALGTVHRTVVLDSGHLAAPEARAAVLRAWDEPVAFGDSDTSLYLFCRSVKGDVTMALSGEGADEIFGGHQWFHDAAGRDGDAYPWLASGIEVSEQTSLLDVDLLKSLDLSHHLRDQYHEALAEVPHPSGPQSQRDRRAREVVYCAITRFLPMLLDRMDRMSMASALEVRVPFLDRRLVEYAYNIPWSMQAFDGREKALLRAAAAHLVLPEVLDRQKSNYPMTQDPAYAAQLRAQLATVLDGPGRAAGMLDLDAVETVTSPNHEPTVADLVQMEQAIRLHGWLNEHGVTFSGQ